MIMTRETAAQRKACGARERSEGRKVKSFLLIRFGCVREAQSKWLLFFFFPPPVARIKVSNDSPAAQRVVKVSPLEPLPTRRSHLDMELRPAQGGSRITPATNTQETSWI